MEWIKNGLIVVPQKNLWWMQTHAMVPFAEIVKDNICKVYFSGRDKNNKSHIGYAIVDASNSFKTIEYSKEPVLTLGNLGCFDDNGVTPSWVMDYNGKKYLYYIGWNKGSTVRMGLIAGLAISDNSGLVFSRYSKAPILERTDREPYSILTGPCVLLDNDIWKMWYVSGIGWVNPDLPRYDIKYAESRDGFKWDRKGVVCVGLKPNENALARPCVLKEDGIYKMWYSYKGECNYRIGYAESEDGIVWDRLDEQAGINVSEFGWDCEMIEYAFVFNYKGKKYMLYNGNDYGKEGIGLAVLEK